MDKQALKNQFKQLSLVVPEKECEEIMQVLPIVEAIKQSVRKAQAINVEPSATSNKDRS